MSQSTASMGGRDRRGDWTPPEGVKLPPLFVWPPQPAKLGRWLFGYPSFFLPWNVFYAAISFLTWQYLTPSLERMQHLEVGWIAFILARNLVIICLVCGAWHLRLYVQKAQGTDYKYTSKWLAQNNPTFLFGNQVLDNIFWTLASAVPVWTAFEVLTDWAFANHYIPYVSWAAHPVWCVVLMCLIPIWRDFHFYLIHRLIHWPPLYRSVHYLHHNNVNVGPWSGMSMHPVEHVLYFSAVLIHWIVPSHPLHAMFTLQHLAFAPAQGHAGFARVVLPGGKIVNTGDFHHYLHHKYIECNYGGDGTVPFDVWFGTYNDGTAESVEKMNRRVLGRG
jgi:sterol desaturase/sphingolipid hydroxylase (fatty acid hydroxylase superfamily)